MSQIQLPDSIIVNPPAIVLELRPHPSGKTQTTFQVVGVPGGKAVVHKMLCEVLAQLGQ